MNYANQDQHFVKHLIRPAYKKGQLITQKSLQNYFRLFGIWLGSTHECKNVKNLVTLPLTVKGERNFKILISPKHNSKFNCCILKIYIHRLGDVKVIYHSTPPMSIFLKFQLFAGFFSIRVCRKGILPSFWY